MRSISQRRDALHKAIRTQELQLKFQHARILLREVDSETAMQIVVESLEKLRVGVQEGNEGAIGLHLTQLHNVAAQYLVVDYFLCEVRFSIELQAVRTGMLPVECTWVDLFFAMLPLQAETVREECCALIYHSLYQIRLKMAVNSSIMDYQSQLHRAIDQFPLSLLADDNLTIACNLLDAIQELLQPQNSHQIIPYLIGIHPNFLEMLLSLLKSEKMSVSEYEERAINTCLMMLFVASHVQYFAYLPEIHSLRSLTKQHLIGRIRTANFSNLLFKKIRALCLSKVPLSCQEMEYLLQNTLLRQVEKRNVDFLQMVAAALHANPRCVPADALGVLGNALFDRLEGRGEEEVCFRQWLAIILHKSLPIFKELVQGRAEGANWESSDFTDRLEALVEVAYRASEPFFYVLLELCYTIWEALPLQRALLSQQFVILSRYSEWRELMETKAVLPEKVFS